MSKRNKKERDIIIISGCEVYLRPSLKKIDIMGTKLGLERKIIKRCRDIAIKYLKKIYQPHYTTVNITYLLPAFIYVGANTNETKIITYSDLHFVFGVTEPTIRKWTKDIIKVLGIQTHRNYKKKHIGLDVGRLRKVRKSQAKLLHRWAQEV